MASINGVSGNNMTSSLYNSSHIISGLASGLDTESMIEGLVQSYQTKINQLNQKATKIEWKQEAYRSIISKLVGFSSKYTSYTSSSNLTSPSFFSNAVKVLTKGEFKDSVTASGKTSSDIQLNAVHQLAQAAQYRTKSNMVTSDTGTIAGQDAKLFDKDAIELSNLSGSLTLTYGSKNISLSFSETGDVDAMNDIRKKLAKEQGVNADEVADNEVLAGLINQKLADQKIVFNNGNSESADQRIKAVVDGDTIKLEELGNAQNGVYISGASGKLGETLGLSEDDLKNASETKPTSMKLNSDLGGLSRKMSGIEYLAEKSMAGAVTMNMSLDGSTKKITMPDVRVKKAEGQPDQYYLDGEAVSKEDFAQKYTAALSESVNKAFNGKVSVENKGSGGALQLEFKVKNEGSDLVINTDVGDALGIGKTATSYLSTSKTLGDLMGKKDASGETVLDLDDYAIKDDKGEFVLDDKGNKQYEFKLNDVTIGTYTKDTQLSKILSDINSNDDAGVKAAYSQSTQSFTFTAKETGADSRVEFGDGLAQAMFGSSGDDKFAGAYGLNLGGDSQKVTFGVPGFKVGIDVAEGDTMENIASKLNKHIKNAIPGSDYTVSYNKNSGQLMVTDSSGKMQDLKVTGADGKELKNKSTSAYTPGQDAIFTATINGEQRLMTRSSNSVNIDGLTINMNETFNSKVDDDGNPVMSADGKFQVDNARQSVTFQNKTDSDKIVDVIKSMVDDYNTMMTEIKSAYATLPYQKSNGAFASYEPLTDEDREGMSESAIERYEAKAKQGILFGDRELSGLYSKMSEVFTFTNTRDVDTLKDMGLSLSYSLSEGGQALTLDEDKLRAYLDNDPDRVSELFTKTDGIMDRMKTQLDSYAKTTGEPKGILIQKAGSPLSSLSLLNNQWQKELDNVNSQIEKWQDKMSNQVDRYTSMFSKLEVLINQMNSQSSTLAGLLGG